MTENDMNKSCSHPAPLSIPFIFIENTGIRCESGRIPYTNVKNFTFCVSRGQNPTQTSVAKLIWLPPPSEQIGKNIKIFTCVYKT